MLPLADKEFFDSVSTIIRSRLDRAAQTLDLIDITGIYGIGTTYSLVAYAKAHNLGVVVGTNDTANRLRSAFAYPHVYSVYDLPDPKTVPQVVIDAGVTRFFVEQQGFKVVTGYYRKEVRRA